MLEIKENVALRAHSTFQVGGPARYAVSVITPEELQEALEFAAEKKCAWRVLGSGSNLLAPDAGYNGLIIWYREKILNVDAESGFIEVGAGAITAVVAGACCRAGLFGFEWAAGIPGTIGGALYGNAGASGGEMKDVVREVCVFENKNVKTYGVDECGFAYRTSRFKKYPAIILGATLRLTRAENSDEPIEKMKAVLKYRADTQPKGLASSGCVFKNYEPTDSEIPKLREKKVPEQFLSARRIPSGWLIEHANLKGHQIGAAQVSTIHGNFIVIVGDAGEARADDIVELIAFVRARVQEKFGVILEEEITILTESIA